MRTDVLGITIDRLTMRECVDKISRAVKDRAILRVVTANPEMIDAAGKNTELKETINSGDLVTPDGVGVVWAAKYLGNPVPERVTGIDLIEALLPVAETGGWKIALVGAKPGVADLAARRIGAVYPHIVFQTHHGYFGEKEEASVLQAVRRFEPDLLLAGLGAGRQEIWLKRNSGLASVSIGVGGSLDTLAGIAKRAPAWVRRLKLEWLYRLGKEPGRLRRQMSLPRFAFKVLGAGFSSRRKRKG